MPALNSQLHSKEYSIYAIELYNHLQKFQDSEFSISLKDSLGKFQKEPVLIIKKVIHSSNQHSSLYTDSLNTKTENERFSSHQNVSDLQPSFQSENIEESLYNDIGIEQIPEQWELDIPLDCHGEYHEIMAEYHIIYSHNWKCPLLYFLFYDQGGTSLSLGAVKNILTSKIFIKSRDLLSLGVEALIPSVEFESTVGVTDHPYLQTPFYFLHPCETHSLLKTVGEVSLHDSGSLPIAESASTVDVENKNYLMIWLGLAGPTVLLYLPQKVILIN